MTQAVKAKACSGGNKALKIKSQTSRGFMLPTKILFYAIIPTCQVFCFAQQNLIKNIQVGYKPAQPSYTPSVRDIKNIRMILSLPLPNRLQTLSTYHSSPQKVFLSLKFLLSSQKESITTRWACLTAMARLYPEKSKKITLRALKSSSWFLRNAGLLALEITHPQKSVKWALHLLKTDPSLVVRTAAVRLIARQGKGEHNQLLKQKLNASDSFYQGQSLWIRHHIVWTLSLYAKEEDKEFFTSLLKDPDQRVIDAATFALKKIQKTI